MKIDIEKETDLSPYLFLLLVRTTDYLHFFILYGCGEGTGAYLYLLFLKLFKV